jgi:hypothetical protein
MLFGTACWPVLSLLCLKGPDSFPVIDDESSDCLGAGTATFDSFVSNINDCQNHIGDYHKSCQQALESNRGGSQLRPGGHPSWEGRTVAGRTGPKQLG